MDLLTFVIDAGSEANDDPFADDAFEEVRRRARERCWGRRRGRRLDRWWWGCRVGHAGGWQVVVVVVDDEQEVERGVERMSRALPSADSEAAGECFTLALRCREVMQKIAA